LLGSRGTKPVHSTGSVSSELTLVCTQLIPSPNEEEGALVLPLSKDLSLQGPARGAHTELYTPTVCAASSRLEIEREWCWD
jgi:hypothetical protein